MPITPSSTSSPPTLIRAANGQLYALTMSPAEAAALLGLGRSSAYDMVSKGTWPTPTTPAGATTRRVLTLPLLQYTGISYEFEGTP